LESKRVKEHFETESESGKTYTDKERNATLFVENDATVGDYKIDMDVSTAQAITFVAKGNAKATTHVVWREDDGINDHCEFDVVGQARKMIWGLSMPQFTITLNISHTVAKSKPKLPSSTKLKTRSDDEGYSTT
jgi:hypothetical protein